MLFHTNFSSHYKFSTTKGFIFIFFSEGVASLEFLVRAQTYKRNQGLNQLLPSYPAMCNVSDMLFLGQEQLWRKLEGKLTLSTKPNQLNWWSFPYYFVLYLSHLPLLPPEIHVYDCWMIPTFRTIPSFRNFRQAHMKQVRMNGPAHFIRVKRSHYFDAPLCTYLLPGSIRI